RPGGEDPLRAAGQLAEEVARPVQRQDHLLPLGRADDLLHRAVLEDEERAGGLVRAGDDVPARGGLLDRALEIEPRLREVGEERDIAKSAGRQRHGDLTRSWIGRGAASPPRRGWGANGKGPRATARGPGAATARRSDPRPPGGD